jgi:hypothetical protein
MSQIENRTDIQSETKIAIELIVACKAKEANPRLWGVFLAAQHKFEKIMEAKIFN